MDWDTLEILFAWVALVAAACSVVLSVVAWWRTAKRKPQATYLGGFAIPGSPLLALHLQLGTDAGQDLQFIGIGTQVPGDLSRCEPGWFEGVRFVVGGSSAPEAPMSDEEIESCMQAVEEQRESVRRGLAHAQALDEPPTSACSRCGGTFPVADLYTGKKSGRQVCEGCLVALEAVGAAKRPAEF